MPVEHKIAVYNRQRRRLESDLADIVRLEPKAQRIAGAWVEPHRLAHNVEHLQHQANADRGVPPGEGHQKALVGELFPLGLSMALVSIPLKYCRDTPRGTSSCTWSTPSAPLPWETSTKRGGVTGSLVSST